MDEHDDDEDDDDDEVCECESCRKGRIFSEHIEGRLLTVWVVLLSIRKDGAWIHTPRFQVRAMPSCDAEDVARSVKASARDLFDVDPSEVKVSHVEVMEDGMLDVLAVVRD